MGPFTDNEWRHHGLNIFHRFKSSEIFYEHENWVELLNLLNNQKSKKHLDKETSYINNVDESYFVIKINNHRYEVFYGTKEAALEKCQILKCLNDVDDECILIQSCEALSYQQALDNLLMYRYHALKQNIPLYWVITKDDKSEIFFGTNAEVKEKEESGYSSWSWEGLTKTEAERVLENLQSNKS
jgi:hypothetical protein